MNRFLQIGLILSIVFLKSNLGFGQNVDTVTYEGKIYYTTDSIWTFFTKANFRTVDIPDGSWILLNRQSVPIFKWTVKDKKVHGPFTSYSGIYPCQEGNYQMDSLWTFLTNIYNNHFKVGEWTTCLSTFKNGVKYGVEARWTTYYNWQKSLEKQRLFASLQNSNWNNTNDVNDLADSLTYLLRAESIDELLDSANYKSKHVLVKSVLYTRQLNGIHHLLKKYSKDTTVVYLPGDAASKPLPFNQLLFNEFYTYNYLKYTVGGTQTIDGRLCHFHARNMKRWRLIRKEFKLFAKKHQLQLDNLAR